MGWICLSKPASEEKVEISINISSLRIWICPPLLPPCKNGATRQLPRISRSQQISEQERATIAWTQQLGSNRGSPTVPMVKDPTAWARWMMSHQFLFFVQILSPVWRYWKYGGESDIQVGKWPSKGTCWTYSSWCEFHWLKTCQIHHICALGPSTRWPRWN